MYIIIFFHLFYYFYTVISFDSKQELSVFPKVHLANSSQIHHKIQYGKLYFAQRAAKVKELPCLGDLESLDFKMVLLTCVISKLGSSQHMGWSIFNGWTLSQTE